MGNFLTCGLCGHRAEDGYFFEINDEDVCAVCFEKEKEKEEVAKKIFSRKETKIGDKVKWTSQSQGVVKEKHGVLTAFLGPDDDAHDLLPAGLPKSRFKGSRVSLNRRGLVEVPRGGHSTLSDYYAPRLSDLVLDVEGE